MTETKKKSNGAYIAKLTLTLFGITFVVALLLGLANAVTADRIAARAAQTKQDSMVQVMGDDAANPAYTYESVSYDASVDGAVPTGADGGVVDVYAAKDSSGTVIGYCVESQANGFAGTVDIMVGVKPDGSCIGVIILKQSETAGMGANCTKDDFRSQFAGVIYGFQCKTKADKKDGDGNIQAMTGSTITSKAVTRGVNYALALVTNGGVQ